MSLQAGRLLTLFGRLGLIHLPKRYESFADEAAQKNLTYLDFLEKLLEAEQ